MASQLAQIRSRNNAQPSQQLLRVNTANELILAVVGHVGSGTTMVCELLKTELEKTGLAGGPFDVVILKASEEIRAWGDRNGKPAPKPARPELKDAISLQDLGDQMRSQDLADVAKALIRKIREQRATWQGLDSGEGTPIAPDGTRRAYILDSLRHPAEVYLLRNVYQIAFALIGVVCSEESRHGRLTRGKFTNAGNDDVQCFMNRDKKDKKKHGQRVDDAFDLADYFLDNSAPRWIEHEKANPHWSLPEQLSRFIRIVTHSAIERPSSSETAMYAASGAQRRSACLSRQVGAALVDREGNLIATGTNEVPKAGGGVYGQGFDGPGGDGLIDERCASRAGTMKRCSNTSTQNEIIQKLLDEFGSAKELEGVVRERRDLLERLLRESPIGALLEFSRAVHAEMDALLSAARKGISPVGGRLFVTTFPCHYCARHIVAAGIDEVQYIEAYPKSKALHLHDDSITMDLEDWAPPSLGAPTKTTGKNALPPKTPKVLFRPFTGVAPRLYARAFLKDSELKDAKTGEMQLSQPDWGGPWDLGRLSYVQLESELSKAE